MHGWYGNANKKKEERIGIINYHKLNLINYY